MKTPFTKSFLPYTEQIKKLKSRNLHISNEAFAIKKLAHLNYYRLSAYYLPFYDDKDHFKNGTNFEEIIKLYYFDKKLRNLIFYAIEKIEVYFRSQIAYVLSKDFGTFGYTKSENFTANTYQHYQLIKDIEKEVIRSKEVFVAHFFEKYSESHLPVWMMVEIISFGTLSKLYKALNPDQKREITDGLGLPQKVFDSWFHTLVYVRNVCAHHSRIWNKMLAIKPEVPRKIEFFKPLNNKKIFFVLTMIEFILEKIDDNEFMLKDELQILLALHPEIKIENMGFPVNWEELELWRD